MEKKNKMIDGEYDPKYNFNNQPSKEEKEAAQKVIEKYEKMINNKK